MFIWQTGPLREGGGGGSGGGAGTGGTPGGTEHPVAAPWAAATDGPWKIGEGEAAKPWWSAIQEEPVRQLMETKGYKNPAETAMAYYNLNKLQNGAPDVVAVPPADADPKAWDALYTKLGRPSDKAAYDLQFGEGVEVDPKMVEFGKELFFDMGLSNDKANKAAEKWNGFVATQQAEALQKEQQENEQAISELETRWGADLEQNKTAGRRVIDALDLKPELVDKIDKNIGSAAVVELLATIGRKSDEGKLVGNGGGGDPNDPASMTKEQANSKIQQLQGDATFMAKYNDKQHPEHAEALKLMERLYAKA